MPLYDYKCKTCGELEVFQNNTENLIECPNCGYHPIERLISRTAPPKFMGAGFYATDYSNKSTKPPEDK